MPLPWTTAAGITQPLATYLDVQSPPVLGQERPVDVQQQLCLQADVDLEGWGKKLEQGPTRHRPMAHPVMFRYISYSTTLAEHAFIAYDGAWPSAGLGHVCSCLFS